MHAIHRPRLELPRAVVLTVVAAMLAIVLTLLLAARLGDISATGATSTRSQPAATTARAHQLQPAWMTNPFASIVTHPMKPLWTVQPPKP